MKKVLAISTALVLLLTSLISCTASGRYKALVIGASDGEHVGDYKIDKELNIKTYNDPGAAREKMIDFNGKQIDTEYKYSVKDILYQSDWDYYACKSDNSEFGINKDTGEIDYYYAIYAYDNPDAEQLTYESCLAIATEQLSKRVDPSDYQMTWQENSFDKNIYTFYFARYINDVPTRDSARIEVSKFGDLTHYYYSCLGVMKNVELPSEENRSKINAAVEERLRHIYEGKEDTFNIAYNAKQMFFDRLIDGNYAMVFEYDVEFSSGGDKYGSYSELITLVVYV